MPIPEPITPIVAIPAPRSFAAANSIALSFLLLKLQVDLKVDINDALMQVQGVVEIKASEYCEDKCL